MECLYVEIENLYTNKKGRKSLLKIKDAAIYVKDGSILEVGKKSALTKKYKKTKKISLDVKTLLPAFVDCHTHTVFAGDRQDEFELRNTGVSYQEIAKRGGGIKKTVKATRKASFDQLLQLAEKRAKLYLQQGVTTIEIKSGYGLNKASELKMLKVANKIKSVRTVSTFLGPHAIPNEAKSSADYLDQVISWLPEVYKICKRADIFIEKGYFSKAQAKKYFTALQELGFDIAAHCEQLSQSQGIDLAVNMNAVSVDHCVHASSNQIKKVAQSATVAVLLPISDYYLNIDYPPARKFIDAGAKVALATDFNPGSSPSQSFNFLGVLARLKMQMSLEEVLSAITLNAACALGLDDVLGSLEVGKLADFVGFDCELNELFYQVNYHPVKLVSRSGKLVFKNKNL